MTLAIALYNPRSSASRKPILPFALLALAAVLGDRRWTLVDGNLHDDPVPALLDALDGGGRPVLAVTCMPGPQLRDAIGVCRRLREARPDVTVVWGGYFPSQHWRACVRSELVDHVVRGYGEVPFVALIDALERGEATPDVPGLAWMADEPVTTGVAPLPNPARLPIPALGSIDLAPYVRSTFLGQRTLGYHSSYGCPYTCVFCAVVSLSGARWKAQSAATVADVFARYHREHGVDAVELYDNNFFVHEARVVELAERVAGLGMAWWGEGRVDTLLGYDDASWRAMARAGLRMVFMGAESGSAETLARMDKGGTLRPEHTLELVARMKGWGVVPELSFVLGSPPEPIADIEHTLDFVRQVMRANPHTEIVLYLYTPEPLDGDLLDAAEQSGWVFPETLEGWMQPEWDSIIQRRSRDLPWIDRGTLSRVRGFERVLHAYWPTSTDTRLRGFRRAALRALAAPRWHLRAYRWPVTLQVAQRLVRYQRPETSGF